MDFSLIKPKDVLVLSNGSEMVVIESRWSYTEKVWKILMQDGALVKEYKFDNLGIASDGTTVKEKNPEGIVKKSNTGKQNSRSVSYADIVMGRY